MGKWSLESSLHLLVGAWLGLCRLSTDLFLFLFICLFTHETGLTVYLLPAPGGLELHIDQAGLKVTEVIS